MAAVHNPQFVSVVLNKLKNLRKKRQRNRERMQRMQLLAQQLIDQKRKMILLCSVLLLMTTKREPLPIIRSIRREPRNTGWWEKVTMYSNTRFKRTLRVTRPTFNYILNALYGDLERQTVTEDPIPPAARLAVCLYRLGRGDYFYTLSEMTGYGESTICQITYEVCCLIVDKLWNTHVTALMPKTSQEFTAKIIDQEARWQFPCGWASVDGCHLPIKQPAGGLEAAKEYHNFKNFFSIVLMGVVQTDYRFVWASSGHTGNTHDALILKSSGLWNDFTEGDALPSIGKKVNDVNVPPCILGDSAFPLQTWLMKPYTNATLTDKQHYFNYRLSRARMTIEGAFGQLKGRWRVLLRKGESHEHTMKVTSLACIVLHNLCIENSDPIQRNLDVNIDPVTQQRRDRDVVRQILHMTECTKSIEKPYLAKKIRDNLCDKVWLEKTTGLVE